MLRKKCISFRHNIWVVPFSLGNLFYGNFRIMLIDYGHTLSLLCGDNDDDEYDENDQNEDDDDRDSDDDNENKDNCFSCIFP